MKKVFSKDKVEDEVDLLKKQYETLETIDMKKIEDFDSLPLSSLTKVGLKQCKFLTPTHIQQLVLKPMLSGRDVVAEAKTGSGKTLSFVIPLIERLVIERISSQDGPAAIVLTPTWELSKQICDVILRVNKHPEFTLMNIMGGKYQSMKKKEWTRIQNSNILVGTPGRFAEHITSNPMFKPDNLQLLILDEADRLLDKTFYKDIQVILRNLPTARQTAIFSATQIRSLKQLHRLSMKSPVRLTTYIPSAAVTPSKLKEVYTEVTLDKKLDFLLCHLGQMNKFGLKTIVFFSTQKQVRFFHMLFPLLNPKLKKSLFELRGNMKQSTRLDAVERFNSRTDGAILLTTNLAERGLDFQSLDMVIQFDCPHMVSDYIHRVGRTARSGNTGRALLYLLPSEIGFIDVLKKQKNIEVKLKQETKAINSVRQRVANLLSKNDSKMGLHQAAQLAFRAYLNDYCFFTKGENVKDNGQTMASVFKPKELPIEAFALSLGLLCTPTLNSEMREKLGCPALGASKGTSVMAAALEAESDSDDLLTNKATPTLQIGEKAFDRGGVVSPSGKLEETRKEEESSDEYTDTKRKRKKEKTRIQKAKKMLKKGALNTIIRFGEDGKPEYREVCGVAVPVEDEVGGPLDIERERLLLVEVDKQDKEDYRNLVRAKKRNLHLKKRDNERAARDSQRGKQFQCESEHSESASEREDEESLDEMDRKNGETDEIGKGNSHDDTDDDEEDYPLHKKAKLEDLEAKEALALKLIG